MKSGPQDLQVAVWDLGKSLQDPRTGLGSLPQIRFGAVLILAGEARPWQYARAISMALSRANDLFAIAVRDHEYGDIIVWSRHGMFEPGQILEI